MFIFLSLYCVHLLSMLFNMEHVLNYFYSPWLFISCLLSPFSLLLSLSLSLYCIYSQSRFLWRFLKYFLINIFDCNSFFSVSEKYLRMLFLHFKLLASFFFVDFISFLIENLFARSILKKSPYGNLKRKGKIEIKQKLFRRKTRKQKLKQVTYLRINRKKKLK